MSDISDFWKCPHCGARNLKTPISGEIVYRLHNNKVLIETAHPDDCPECKGKVSGGAILSGKYDDYLADIIFHLQAGGSLGCGGLAAILVPLFLLILGLVLGFRLSSKTNLIISGVCFLIVAILPYAVGHFVFPRARIRKDVEL